MEVETRRWLAGRAVASGADGRSTEQFRLDQRGDERSLTSWASLGWGVRWSSTSAQGGELGAANKPRRQQEAAVGDAMKKVLDVLDEMCTLEPSTFASVYRDILGEDEAGAEEFFEKIRDKTAENGMQLLYQMAIQCHCSAGDLAGLQRRQDEALLKGLSLPAPVHEPMLRLFKEKGETEAALFFVRQLREEGSLLCAKAATVYVRSLVARAKYGALEEFLEDLLSDSIALYKPQWSRLMLNIVASLLALPGEAGDRAVRLGRLAQALAEKVKAQQGTAADLAKCYKRLLELYMTHNAPSEAAEMVEAFLRLQASSGFQTDRFASVVSSHLGSIATELLGKGKLDVAMKLAESLCQTKGDDSVLPSALPGVARHVLYHIRYLKEKGPEVEKFLIDSIMPAMMRLKPRGYQSMDQVDKCFFNAVCVSHSLPSSASFRVLQMTLNHYERKSVSSRILKTLLNSAAQAPSLPEGLECFDRMAKLRWNFADDSSRVGLSHATFVHLSPSQMEVANRRSFIHFYPETLELVAKARQYASKSTVRFMLHLLRQLEEGGTADVPQHVTGTLQMKRKALPDGGRKNLSRKRKDIANSSAPELFLDAEEDPLAHMSAPPGVSAWDYRNVMVVARQLDYLDALVYAVTMAHSNGMLELAIDLLPVEQQDVREYIEAATRRKSLVK